MRKLPEPEDGEGRVETGVVQFGDDWPGIFIRGDDALHYAFLLRQVEALMLSCDAGLEQNK